MSFCSLNSLVYEFYKKFYFQKSKKILLLNRSKQVPKAYKFRIGLHDFLVNIKIINFPNVVENFYSRIRTTFLDDS